MRTSVDKKCTYVCRYVSTGIHTCIDAYMHACNHACMQSCMHAYMHTYRHTWTQESTLQHCGSASSHISLTVHVTVVLGLRPEALEGSIKAKTSNPSKQPPKPRSREASRISKAVRVCLESLARAAGMPPGQSSQSSHIHGKSFPALYPRLLGALTKG